MTSTMHLLYISTLLIVGVTSTENLAVLEYGVDVSFPMHHYELSSNFPWLPHNTDPANNSMPLHYKDMPIQYLGDKKAWYNGLINGCVDHYGKFGRRCLNNERERVDMSRRQPQSMVNYTQHGYTKLRAPVHVFKLIQDFWKANKDEGVLEMVIRGSTLINNWEAPTTMVAVENETLTGGGAELRQSIWNSVRDTISDWTGQQLAECSLYGIRVYHEGAVLATHVDRLPLVSSAIINVAQDVDEPWPLEVIGRDGKAHNITMEPGDLVLYESHSILHGRPFPLKGRFMANIFIHFEPIGPIGEEIEHGTTTDLPPYVISGSPEDDYWRMRNPRGYQVPKPRPSFDGGSTKAHVAARMGNLNDLKDYVTIHEESVNSKDDNGWTPLHEGVRMGSVEVVRFLLEKGSNVNSLTKAGESPLFRAKEKYGEDHPILDVLKEYRAQHVAPGESVEEL